MKKEVTAVKKRVISGLLCCMFLFLTGCQTENKVIENNPSLNSEKLESNSSSGTGGYKEHIIIGVQQDVDTMDPHNSTVHVIRRYCPLIYETLITKDADGNLAPMLAESWEILSDTEICFHLRKGVTFHNGDEMKSNDVKFSIERAASTARHSSRYSCIESITCEDDYTVTLHLNEIASNIFSNLSDMLFGGAIISERFANEVGDDIGTKACGTGKYVMVSWKSGDKMELERYDDYWGEPAISEKMTIRVITEDTSRLIALENGEIDISDVITTSNISRVEENSELKLLSIVGTSLPYWAFNLNKEPLNDPKVRLALCYGLDRESVALGSTDGASQVSRSLIPVGIAVETDDLEFYEYNPEKAKELLAEAGYPNGFAMDLYVKSTDSVTMLAAQIIQGSLSIIGIDVNINAMESTALMAALAAGEHMSYILSVSATDYFSPSILYYSETPPRTGNRMFYNSPEFDEAYEGLLSTYDEEEQRAYVKAEEIALNTDLPAIPLFDLTFQVGARSNVEGIVLKGSGWHDFSGAYVIN